MKQIALISKLSEDIEEEVTIKIDNVEFVAFANILPYELEIGKSYEVLVGITILDDFEIHEINFESKEIMSIDNTFKYLIRGFVKESGIIDAGIIIEDEIFKEYQYLIGRYIEVEVDRINVEFL